MKYEVKRIGVFSAVKTLFLIGGLLGFFMGLVQWFFMRAFLMLWQGMLAPPGLVDQGAVDGLFSNLMAATGIVVPLFGALAGAVGGVVTGFLVSILYNLGARLWGGLEFEWDSISSPVKPTMPAPLVPGAATPLPAAATDPPAVSPSGSGRDDKPEKPPRPRFE